MSSHSSLSAPPPAQILLVDNNHIALKARKTVLEEQGYSITTAKATKEALQQLSERRFDLVITDCRVCEKKAADMVAQIRNAHECIPVILISSYLEGLGLTEKSTGADAVILKSANEVSVLVRLVSRLLRQKPTRKGPARPSASPRTRRKGIA